VDTNTMHDSEHELDRAVAAGGDGYFDDADGADHPRETTAFDDAERGEFVNYEQVARNLAASVPDGPAIFHRQVRAHTFPLDSALDALPPGIKAWLFLLRGKIDTQSRQITQMGQDIELLESRLARLEAPVPVVKDADQIPLVVDR
jgi:hypothetical protein